VPTLRERLADGASLLLDGAMGTELDRRGLPTVLPLWSAVGLIERPDLVRAIHADYIAAGADIITTNTFRTTGRTLARAGRDRAEAERLNALAVEQARAAATAAAREVLVAGSIAPLEDCYSPWLTPPFEVALDEHREQAARFAASGVDGVLIETMPTAGEAEAALIAVTEVGLTATVGFVCQVGANEPVRLLSGETLATAIERVQPHRPAAILANCAAPAIISRALAELRALTKLPTGGYANVGVVDPVTGWAADETVSPDRYAAVAAGWIEIGARLIGGCCGTTPAHIAALRRLIDGTTRHPA
jgi:S-methylmethionine-dependent homocysteine/selenocysteine methylase